MLWQTTRTRLVAGGMAFPTMDSALSAVLIMPFSIKNASHVCCLGLSVVSRTQSSLHLLLCDSCVKFFQPCQVTYCCTALSSGSSSRDSSCLHPRCSLGALPLVKCATCRSSIQSMGRTEKTRRGFIHSTLSTAIMLVLEDGYFFPSSYCGYVSHISKEYQEHP